MDFTITAICFLKDYKREILDKTVILCNIVVFMYNIWASLVAQTEKRQPAMQETWVQSLGCEDPLEKEMAIHFSILAWRISWTEEPGGLPSMGSQKESDTTEQIMCIIYTYNMYVMTYIPLPLFAVSVRSCSHSSRQGYIRVRMSAC